MSCCNDNLIKITKVTTTSTGVVLIPARTIAQTNLTDTGKYRLIIGCGLRASSSLPVYIQTSAGNIPLLSKYGNVLYANQLRTRYQYCIGYGNNNTTAFPLGQFINFTNICCYAYSSETTTTDANTQSLNITEKKVK